MACPIIVFSNVDTVNTGKYSALYLVMVLISILIIYHYHKAVVGVIGLVVMTCLIMYSVRSSDEADAKRFAPYFLSQRIDFDKEDVLSPLGPCFV